jgi:hypothetical protein
MAPDDDVKQLALDCLRSWVDGDFERTRRLLDDDVTFRGPLGATDGADAYVEGVQGIARIVQRVDIEKVAADGEDVCVRYDLVTESASLPTVGWYEVRNGKVRSVAAFFDPRPLLT